MTSAYCVPAVTLTADVNVPVYHWAAPLLKPGIVAVARSLPVGSPPEVARTDSVRSGVVPVHPEQKRLMSAFVRTPLTAGVKVWPPYVVVVMPLPKLPSVSFFWSIGVRSGSWMFPGLETKSQLVGTPRWNAFCVLSVKHPLWAAALSVKFRIAVPPSGTEIAEAEAESKPSLLTESEG